MSVKKNVRVGCETDNPDIVKIFYFIMFFFLPLVRVKIVGGNSVLSEFGDFSDIQKNSF